MTKLQFLISLNKKFSKLPKEEAEERLRFYSEMIEDRVEEGLSEEEAVAQICSVNEISVDILPQEKEKRKLKAWEIVLLAAGSPVWVSLLIAAFAVALSLYISAWSVIISLWAVFAALGGSGTGGVVLGAVLFLRGNIPGGIAMIGAGLLCAGLALLLFFGCKALTRSIILLTKKLFARKGGAK